jgi:hypothetical protein
MLRLGYRSSIKKTVWFLTLVSLVACGTSGAPTYFHDPNMDFAALRTIAVLPFVNLTRDKLAGERVRDIFANSLLSTGALYVIPAGEVARGISRAGVVDPTMPSAEEIVKLAGIIKADAVITGVVREYGEIKSGSTSANVVSLSLEMIEVQSQKVVWSAASTKGGISPWDRLLGGGGRPMNDVTKAAIDDIINKLFQ